MIIYFAEKHPDFPGPVQVYVRDTETRKITPLKHIVRHSPDGFQFSYVGSGPADLALSILTDYSRGIGKEEVVEHYQDFKEKFIAPAKKSLYITNEQIDKWISSLPEN